MKVSTKSLLEISSISQAMFNKSDNVPITYISLYHKIINCRIIQSISLEFDLVPIASQVGPCKAETSESKTKPKTLHL